MNIVQKEDSWWYDTNNNKWLTKELAEKFSVICCNCSYCSYFKQNPARYFTIPIGSRNKQTKFYWTSSADLQVTCGCFTGSLPEFEAKVQKTHGSNEHALAYQKVIALVKTLIA